MDKEKILDESDTREWNQLVREWNQMVVENTIAEDPIGMAISLAKCHERSREKDKRIANLQATNLAMGTDNHNLSVRMTKAQAHLKTERGLFKAKIEDLQATIAKLRDALKSIRDADFISLSNPGERLEVFMRKTARAALKQEN